MGYNKFLYIIFFEGFRGDWIFKVFINVFYEYILKG